MPPVRIAIVGGGFAGVACARTLRGALRPDQADVVLFNRENHMVFHPLLADVAGGSINPDAVGAPLRQMLPGVRCRTEEVERIDLDGRAVEFEAHDGQPGRMLWDHLVIACGGAVNLGMVPGMADHAFPLKTAGDAMALRAHVMQQLEKAEICENPARRRWYLSFIIVGGGYSGVESAGELHDLAVSSRRFFPNIGADEIQVTLVHSRDQLLPEISPPLREFARKKMEQSGIRVRLNTRVVMATPDGVGLGDGTKLSGATVVCTVGTTMSPVVQRLDAVREGGRLLTGPDMRLEGRADAWAVGDCARIINSFDGQLSPPTGQFAERQGRQAAENILRVLQGRSTRPFRFRPIGQLCSIGGRRAVAEIFGIRLWGFLAWFVWRGVYLFKLPTLSRQVKVGFDWAWELIFDRDLLHLRTDTTERVSRAHYHSGDIVFRQGDPAANFYVIGSGEVEVVREEPEGERVLAVLGPGDFFGEMALINNKPRSATIRARSPLDVTVMGRNVFTHISGSLAPLRDLLAGAVRRRTATQWHNLPAVRERLEGMSVAEFMDPLPEPLHQDSPFSGALAQFNDGAVDCCCIVDGSGRLKGLLARTDLLKAIESGAMADSPLSQFMIADPVAVTGEDACLMAAETMRVHGLKGLPVVAGDRRLQGYLRAERLLGRLFD